MEKGINLRIKEFNENIAKAINEAKLPPGISSPILNSFARSMELVNEQMIAVEEKAFEEGDKQDGEKIH